MIDKTRVNVHPKFKRLAYVPSVVLLSAFGVAQAQEVAPGGERENKVTLEEVVVTGIRTSMERNLDIKRYTDAMVDAITAEDIGKFPDKNVADSLQRVPGIVITRDGGEGSNVSIRGLSSDLTLTQLNGNFIASSPGEPSRSFDYTLLPSAMVQRVEVFKSSEARLDEGGVGGTIILYSRKPLDMEANSGVLDVESTYADVSEEYEPSFTGVYAWKNEAENFGVLVGYTHQERTNRSLTGSTELGGGWRFAASPENQAVDANGNPFPDSTRRFSPLQTAQGDVYDGVWVPQVTGVWVTEENRERDGIQFTSQWEPTDEIGLELNLFSYTLSQDRTTSRMVLPEWSNNPDFLNSVTLDSSGTVATGVDYSAGASGQERNLQFPWIIGDYIEEKSTSDTYDFRFNYEGDGYQARVVLGHTESEGGPREQWTAAYKSGAPASFTSSGRDESAAQYAGWSLRGDQVTVYSDPDVLANLHAGIGGENDPGSTGSSFIVSDFEEDYAQLDVDFDVEWGVFDKLRTGVKYRDGSLHRETRNTFFVLPEFFDEIVAGREVNVAQDLYQWNGGMPLAADIINSKSEDNIAGGFNVNVMPTINWDRYRDLVSSQFPKYTRREPNFVFEIEEKITAAYVQGDFRFDNFRGNLGVRVVETTTNVLSSDQFTLFLDQNDDATGEQIVGDDRFIDVTAFIGRESTDVQVLPSFNIVWDITDDLVLRGAASKTMSRPPITALGGQENLSFVSEEWANDRLEFNGETVDPGWSGGGGNKDLKPFESVNFDVSVEYYYREGSAVGLALFNKDVDNFVVPLQISSTRNFDGLDGILPPGEITVNPYVTSANGTDATSRGVEIFIQHAFDNGFGFYANYTYNDTNQADISVGGEKVGESELVGSAEDQINFSAYYESAKFSVRASYNRRGEMVLGLRDGLNVFADPYEQVDVNAAYNITDAVSITASIINLTEEEEVTRLGNDTDVRLLTSSYSGRRAFLGVNYKF